MNPLETDSMRSSLYNIIDYGAVSDGETVNTQSIQKAIDDCAGNGGGSVLFPAGTFISGTLFLKSHVSLHLQPGAVLLGSKDVNDYPTRPKQWRRSLIYGEGLENISITGQGIIDGNLEAFLQNLVDESEFDTEEELRKAQRTEWRGIRPLNVLITECRHVALKDVTLKRSGFWCVCLRECRNARISGISLDNRTMNEKMRANKKRGNPNSDGVNIYNCENVRISDCDINSSDDALVFRGACKNITTTNCVLSSNCQTVVMWSSDVFENISISNCVMYNANKVGVALRMTEGCRLNNVSVSNIVMERVNCALWIQQAERPGHEPKGGLSNIVFSNIQATGTDSIGCAILGMPSSPLRNVTLSNIRISFEGGGIQHLVDQEIGELPRHDENVFGRKLAQRFNNHDQFGMLPAYGFFCRHVDGLVMENINLSCRSADYRPAVYIKDGRDSRLSGLRASYEEETESLVVINSSQNIAVTGCHIPKKIGALAALWKGSKNIRLTNNHLFRPTESYISDGTISESDIITD